MNNHPILFYSYNHSAAKANFYLNTDKINVIYQKPNFSNKQAGRAVPFF